MKPLRLALLFLVLPLAESASAQTPTNAPPSNAQQQTQSDQKHGLVADRGGWGFHAVPVTDPSLPRVLLIGDSILNGYRDEVVRQLKGKANVASFTTGLNLGLGDAFTKPLQEALAQGPYAVIHFNDIGLHAWQKGRIPEGQYEPLLRQYLQNLQAGSPGAKLIWTTTTPITVKGAPTTGLDPTNAVIVERNAIAARVMQELGIPTDDLYTLMAGRWTLVRGDQFHWNAEGQKLQGDQVAASIEAVLQGQAPPVPAPTPAP